MIDKIIEFQRLLKFYFYTIVVTKCIVFYCILYHVKGLPEYMVTLYGTAPVDIVEKILVLADF